VHLLQLGLNVLPAPLLAALLLSSWPTEILMTPLTSSPPPCPGAGIRACKPNVQAIRNAAADVLYGEPPTPVNIVLPRYGIAGTPQVCAAGCVLGLGWPGSCAALLR
jgi:hypothetical protein